MTIKLENYISTPELGNIQRLKTLKYYNFPYNDLNKIFRLTTFLSQNNSNNLFFVPDKEDYSQFRFDIDLNSAEDKPLYTENQIKSSILIINNVLSQSVDEIKDKNLTCCVLEKPRYFSSEKNRWKNGIHLQYPYLYLINSELKGIVSQINERLKRVFSPDVFQPDLTFYANRWPIYGANKPGEEHRYEFQTAYNSKLTETIIPELNLLRLFWFNPTEETYQYCLDTKIEADDKPHEFDDDAEIEPITELSQIEESLYSLSQKHVEETKYWKMIICSLVSLSKEDDKKIDLYELKDVLNEWSQKTEIGNYSKEGFNRVWNYALSEKNKVKSSVFSRLVSKDNYLLRLYSNMDDLSVAKLVSILYKDKLFMMNDKIGWIYIEEDKIWKEAKYYEIYDLVIEEVLKVGKQAENAQRRKDEFEKAKELKKLKGESASASVSPRASPSKVNSEVNSEVNSDELEQDEFCEQVNGASVSPRESVKNETFPDFQKREIPEIKIQEKPILINDNVKEYTRQLKEYEKQVKERDKFIEKFKKDEEKRYQKYEIEKKRYYEKTQKLKEKETEKRKREAEKTQKLKEKAAEKAQKLKEKEINKINKNDNTIALKKFTNYISSVNYKKQLSTSLTTYCHNPNFEEKFNCFNYLFPIKDNQVINLKTGEIAPRTQEHFFTFKSDIKIVEETKRAEKFFIDLANGNMEISLYLQKLLLYCLSGLTFDRSFYLLSGVGRNGKSTYLNIISTLLGKQLSGNADKNLIIVDKKHGNRYGGANPFLCNLRGKRTVFVSETENDDLLNASMIKGLTGDDIIESRYLHSNGVISFRNQSKIIIASNFPLEFHNADKAVQDRYKYVKFSNVFPVNTSIGDEIKTNKSGFLDEIFSLCLRNGKDSLFNEKIECKEVSYDTNILFRELDTVETFISECCSRENDKCETINLLYYRYKDHCKQNEMMPLKERAFSKAFENKGFQKIKATSGEFRGKVVFLGIKVSHNDFLL